MVELVSPKSRLQSQMDPELPHNVDICITCVTDKPPQLPLREELPSLGIEVVYNAQGVGAKASKHEARKHLQQFREDEQFREQQKIRIFPQSSKKIEQKLQARKEKEAELRVPTALSYEDYEKELVHVQKKQQQRELRDPPQEARQEEESVSSDRSSWQTTSESGSSSISKLNQLGAAPNATTSPRKDGNLFPKLPLKFAFKNKEPASPTKKTSSSPKRHHGSSNSASPRNERLVSIEPVQTSASMPVPATSPSRSKQTLAGPNSKYASPQERAVSEAFRAFADDFTSDSGESGEGESATGGEGGVSLLTDGQRSHSPTFSHTPSHTTKASGESSNDAPSKTTGSHNDRTAGGSSLEFSRDPSSISTHFSSHNPDSDPLQPNPVEVVSDPTTKKFLPGLQTVSESTDVLAPELQSLSDNSCSTSSMKENNKRQDAKVAADVKDAFASLSVDDPALEALGPASPTNHQNLEKPDWMNSAKRAIENVAAEVYKQAKTAAGPAQHVEMLVNEKDGTQTPVASSIGQKSVHAFWVALQQHTTPIDSIHRMLRVCPGLVKVQLLQNGRMGLHALCNQGFPNRLSGNQSPPSKKHPRPPLATQLVDDIARLKAFLQVLVEANPSACMVQDSKGDLPAHLLARILMEWEAQWYEKVYEKVQHDQDADGRNAAAITKLYQNMSQCIETVLSPVALAANRKANKGITRITGSVGRLLPLHLASIFTASVTTLRYLLEADSTAASIPCDLDSLRTFIPDKSLPLELHDKLSTDFPKWELQQARNNKSPKDDYMRRSDLLFAFHPTVGRYRSEKARIARLEAKIIAEAAQISRGNYSNQNLQLSTAVEKVWVWFCTFRDPDCIQRAPYVQTVGKILESLPLSAVHLLVSCKTSQGKMLAKAAAPEVRVLLQLQLDKIAKKPTRDLSPRRRDDPPRSVGSMTDGSIMTDLASSPSSVMLSLKGKGYVGVLCRTLFNIQEDAIPTSFILLPYKLTKNEHGKLGIDKKSSASTAVKFAECLLKLTDPKTILHFLEQKSVQNFDQRISADSDDEFSATSSIQKYREIESSLISLYESGKAYLYLIDELIGLPIVPSSSESLYPIEMSSPASTVRKLLPLMLTGMILMRGEKALSVLVNVLLDKTVSHVHGNWVDAAREIIAYLYTQQDHRADGALPGLDALVDELKAFVSNNSSVKSTESVAKLDEWSVELSILRMVIQMNDSKRSFAGLKAKRDEPGTVLWTKHKIEEEIRGENPALVAVQNTRKEQDPPGMIVKGQTLDLNSVSLPAKADTASDQDQSSSGRQAPSEKRMPQEPSEKQMNAGPANPTQENDSPIKHSSTDPLLLRQSQSLADNISVDPDGEYSTDPRDDSRGEDEGDASLDGEELQGVKILLEAEDGPSLLDQAMSTEDDATNSTGLQDRYKSVCENSLDSHVALMKAERREKKRLSRKKDKKHVSLPVSEPGSESDGESVSASDNYDHSTSANVDSNKAIMDHQRQRGTEDEEDSRSDTTEDQQTDSGESFATASQHEGYDDGQTNHIEGGKLMLDYENVDVSRDPNRQLGWSLLDDQKQLDYEDTYGFDPDSPRRAGINENFRQDIDRLDDEWDNKRDEWIHDSETFRLQEFALDRLSRAQDSPRSRPSDQSSSYRSHGVSSYRSNRPGELDPLTGKFLSSPRSQSTPSSRPISIDDEFSPQSSSRIRSDSPGRYDSPLIIGEDGTVLKREMELYHSSGDQQGRSKISTVLYEEDVLVMSGRESNERMESHRNRQRDHKDVSFLQMRQQLATQALKVGCIESALENIRIREDKLLSRGEMLQGFLQDLLDQSENMSFKASKLAKKTENRLHELEEQVVCKEIEEQHLALGVYALEIETQEVQSSIEEERVGRRRAMERHQAYQRSSALIQNMQVTKIDDSDDASSKDEYDSIHALDGFTVPDYGDISDDAVSGGYLRNGDFDFDTKNYLRRQRDLGVEETSIEYEMGLAMFGTLRPNGSDDFEQLNEGLPPKLALTPEETSSYESGYDGGYDYNIGSGSVGGDGLDWGKMSSYRRFEMLQSYRQ